MTRRRNLVAFLGAMLLAGRAAADTAPVDLRTVERSATSNDALACPAGACSTPAEIVSPVLALSPEILLERARAVLAREPRTELVAEDKALRQLVFVQRSAVFGFPDSVWVQAVAAGEGASAIVYSRSNYGTWDFGVNRKRVERWMDLLTEEGTGR